MDPTYVVLDDIQFPEMQRGMGLVGVDRAFGYVAYTIDQPGLSAVLASFAAQKEAIGLDRSDPIKAVMDKDWAISYHGWYGREEGSRRFKVARANAGAIGRRVARGLVDQGATINASLVWPFSSTPEREDLCQWAFEALLQRIAFDLRDRRPGPNGAILIADRCNPTDQARLQRGFREATFHARTTGGARNIAGPLVDLGLTPTLGFASTLDSPLLQVADFVARGCRDFISWWHNPHRLPDLFLPLIPGLRRSAAGEVDRYGFLIYPSVGVSVDSKISELTQVASAAGLELS